jgi:hypothetical protein
MKLPEFNLVGRPRTLGEWAYQSALGACFISFIVWLAPNDVSKWVLLFAVLCFGSLVRLWFSRLSSNNFEETIKDD